MPKFDKLIAHYSMEELGSGDDLVDDHTSGITVTHVTSGADSGSTGGVVGKSRTFNRLASQHFESNNSAFELGNNTNFSITGWLYMNSFPATTILPLVSKWAATTNNREYLVYYSTTDSRFHFDVTSAGTAATFSGVTADNFGAASINTWYFLAAVHDGSSGELRFFINNQAETPVAHAGGVHTATSVMEVGGSGTINAFHDGRIDQVAFYDDVLTNDEITNDFGGGTGLAYPLSEPGVPGPGRQRFPNRRRPRVFWLDEEGRPSPELNSDGTISFIPGQSGIRRTGVQIKR